MDDLIEEKESAKQDYRVIPGLGTAMMQREEGKIMEMLSEVRPGEKVMILGLIVERVKPTKEEEHLLQKSQEEQREYGLVRVGQQQTEIEGKRASLNDDKVWEAVRRLVDLNEEQDDRTFSHTHWDRDGTPVFSGPDVTVARHLSEGWGFTCRLVSWLPKTVFIFRGTM